MMDFENLKKEIETLVQPVIHHNGLHLHSINKIDEFGGPGIEILVFNKSNANKSLDFETLSKLNEELSLILDKKLKLSDEYYLIVGSRGVEKEITSEAELIKAIDKYLALDLDHEVKNLSHFEGYLKSYNPETKLFLLEFFKKGQKQKVNFNWNQITKIRHAVKF